MVERVMDHTCFLRIIGISWIGWLGVGMAAAWGQSLPPASSNSEDPHSDEVASGMPPMELSPQEGVLLLRNGEVLSGKIVRGGDFYYVVVPNGQVRIRTMDVEGVCRSLQEGYQFKRHNIRLPSAQEHLHLGQWCIRHGLIEEAQRELAEALRLQPHHPLAALLQRQIELARHPVEVFSSPSDQEVAPTGDANKLETWVRTLPPVVVEQFTQWVQPILLNNCTAAGCHGPTGKNRFCLLKPPTGQSGTRRLTQRNLASTFQWINPNEPLQSPLLTAPLGPHGSAKTPIFGNPQAEAYQRLLRWVLVAAKASSGGETMIRTTPSAPGGPFSLSAITPSRENPAQPTGSPEGVVPAIAVEQSPQMVQQAGVWQPVPGQCLPQGPFQDLIGSPPNGLPTPSSFLSPIRPRFSPPPRSEPKRGDPQAGEFRPTDPFDPEIFNRRYHPPAQPSP